MYSIKLKEVRDEADVEERLSKYVIKASCEDKTKKMFG